EWLALKRADVRAKTPHGNDDDLKAMEFVRNNPDKVKEMIEAAAARKAATQPSTAPATQAAATSTAPAAEVAATSTAVATAPAAALASTQTAPATRPLST